MPDREKVIKALEACVNNGFTSCEGCPYDYPDRVGCQAIQDALALLKEQQEQIDRLLEESASNAEMAEEYAEMLNDFMSNDDLS